MASRSINSNRTRVLTLYYQITFGVNQKALDDQATLNYFVNLPEIKGQPNTRQITNESHTTIAQHIINIISRNNTTYTINIYNTIRRLLKKCYWYKQFLTNDISDKHGVVIKGLLEQGNTKELNREPGNQLQNLNNVNAKGRRINTIQIAGYWVLRRREYKYYENKLCFEGKYSLPGIEWMCTGTHFKATTWRRNRIS